MITEEQFISVVVPYLRQVGAIPKRFVQADDREFLFDLFTICSDDDATAWQQQSFMFDKYAAENLDFRFVVTVACAVMSNADSIPGTALLDELTGIAIAFLAKAAPLMPLKLARETSKFVVTKSAFHADFPGCRAPLDACAATDWEDFSLPQFDWPWPELIQELSIHKNDVPEHLCRENRTAGGGLNLEQWRKQIWQRPISHWLEQNAMKDLRNFQKQYALGPARTKIGLIELIASMYPLPDNIRAVVEDARHYELHRVDAEEEARKQPLSELYKNHLITLVQTRVDSYFEATHGYSSPQSQRRDAEKRTLEAAQREFENAKSLDLTAEEHSLRAAYAAELGPNWERRKAAKLVFTHT